MSVSEVLPANRRAWKVKRLATRGGATGDARSAQRFTTATSRCREASAPREDRKLEGEAAMGSAS
jgi:hypothetical protein